MFDRIKEKLAARETEGLYRERLQFDVDESNLLSSGQDQLDFASNDYLGLARHPDVVDAANKALQHYGVGAAASHLICGHLDIHQTLEVELAKFLKRDKAVLFSTGYMANLGCIGAIGELHSIILQDKLNHASLLDAGQQGKLRSMRYLHADMESLEKKLKRHERGSALIVSDSVFSMDGDIAPLSELAQLSEAYQATLMIDDAHGFGVLGDSGAGAAEYAGLDQQKLPLVMGTLGKALGAFGAFVAGESAVIDYLIQFARPYIYTTALPPAIAAAALKSLQLIQTEPRIRQRLNDNIDYFRSKAHAASFELMPSRTAIQPVSVSCDRKVLALANALRKDGIMVGAIRPPTVAQGQSRLRISLSAKHSKAMITYLVDRLALHMETIR